jgi:hypothetical protein
MTTTTSPHEEFEIAALRRARGALDADGAARLDAHLATCAACQGFAETAAATGRRWAARTRTATASRDWAATRAAFRDRRRARGWPPDGVGADAARRCSGGRSRRRCSGRRVVVRDARRVAKGRGGRRAGATSRVVDELAFWARGREIAVIRRSKPLFPMLAASFGGLIAVNLALLAKALFFDDRPSAAGLLILWSSCPVRLARRAQVVLPRLERERLELGE